MSIVEINKIEDAALFPLAEGEEPQAKHFEALRERMWLLEHPCAGNIDTTIKYGKWVGDDSNFLFVDYDQYNWHWLPDADYHPGDPIVKYRWGPDENQVDIFIFTGTAKGLILNANPPVSGGKINSLWLLGTDPNKYAHWNFNAGRPDIEAEHRWIFDHHGYTAPPEGVGWEYGLWEAWKELPRHTDPYEQIPHLKHNGVTAARHHPVEQDRDYISQRLQTTYKRKFQDGTVGITPWWHGSVPEMISEYASKDGNPTDSIQWGPDWSDKNFNSAFQDRILQLIERNYTYATKVDEFWKQNWQYWLCWGIEIDPNNDDGCPNKHPDYVNWAGDWVDGTYYKGNAVRHAGWYWRCIAGNANTEPGVTPGWEDYWVKDLLHQPDYMKTDPVYVQFSDYLHRCNSSAFEKVLKNIGHYDWYFDITNPAVPWWLYQKHYYALTHYMGNPEGDGLRWSRERWPLPRGCWRRVWRYTQNWNKDRYQPSRFGKEININGKMVSMMWPGELGDPPGYDEQLAWWGDNGTYYWHFWWYKHLVTQAVYDQLERPPGAEWTYTKNYCVIDYEEKFRQAYLNNSSIESKIAERHDPIATDWIDAYNENTGLWEKELEPIFELQHDLINDMREALLELNLFGQLTTIAKTNYSTTGQLYGFSSSLAAYTAGKDYCDDKANKFVGSGLYGNVGYIGFVVGNPPPWDTVGSIRHSYNMEKSWVEVTITKDVNEGFPATDVGTLIFDIFAGGGPLDEPCRIGIPGVFSFMPPKVYDTPPRAYIGLIPMTCEQVHTGAGGEPTDWTTICKFEIVPAEPWMPDAMFSNVYLGKDYYKQSNANVETGSDLSIAWSLDFNGYKESVFQQDPTNFIEV